MKWPRGRCNGKRIVGVRANIVIDVTQWWLFCELRFGILRIFVGPVHAWLELEYEH